jgi:DNA-binding NarL/FixJ family response regulator
LEEGLLERGSRTIRGVAQATVLLSTEHPSYREGLAEAIDAHAQLELVAACADGESTVQEIVSRRPALCVLDVALRPSGGLHVCRSIREVAPDVPTRFVLMSSESGASLSGEARAAGADAVVDKDTPRAQLCELLVELVELAKDPPVQV